MCDLEQELKKWRQTMHATGLAPEILAELEEHLREDIERQLQAGTSLPDALHAARQRMGEPNVLRNEFALVDQPGVTATLHRHKWKLVLCTGAGMLVALVFHILRPAAYESETKLLIRYVATDGQFVTRGFDQPVAAASDGMLKRIMDEQMNILASAELAQRVAGVLGPERILKEVEPNNGLVRATALIQQGLLVKAPTNSSVLHLAFRHPDSELIPLILREVVDQFLRMHVEAFRARNDSLPSPGRVTNISLIKPASTPAFDFAALLRMQALPIFAGIFTGFAWGLLERIKRARWKLAR